MIVKLWSDGAFCGIKSELVVKVDDDADLDSFAEDYLQQTLEPSCGYEILDDDTDEEIEEDWT